LELGVGDDILSHAGEVKRTMVVAGGDGTDTYTDLGGKPVNPDLRSIESIV
jgi:hypothetical protein